MAPPECDLRTILSVLTDDFDYQLPRSAISLTPAEPRDSARLLVHDGERVEHRLISDLPSLVGPGDVVVVNNTRVLPARVRFNRTSGGSGEVLLLRDHGDGWWDALARPSAKLVPGSVVRVGPSLLLEFGEDLGEGMRRVRVESDTTTMEALERWGEMPLPPYLSDVDLDDPDRYQTVFAKRAASAAAPTAGLHLTSAVLEGITSAGAELCEVELVVGLDTFRPITTERVDDHAIHEEHYSVSPEAWQAIRSGNRVIAIGTTTVRCLESAAVTGELEGRTRLFITPGFRFDVVDVVLTNFHLPRSSLLVMVEAFAGPGWRTLYAEALAAGYRFLSFGDAMWVPRDAGLAR